MGTSTRALAPLSSPSSGLDGSPGSRLSLRLRGTPAVARVSRYDEDAGHVLAGWSRITFPRGRQRLVRGAVRSDHRLGRAVPGRVPAGIQTKDQGASVESGFRSAEARKTARHQRCDRRRGDTRRRGHTKNGARRADLTSTFGRRLKRSHRRATLPHKKCAVPSPKRGLTSVFGMGTGVAPALWTVGKTQSLLPVP